MRRIIALAAAALVVAALAGCTAEPEYTEEEARITAIAMDPMFEDDEVWGYALTVAEGYCKVAESAGREFAIVAIESRAEAAGVTGKQAGIMAGIGEALYCPGVAEE